MKKLFQLIIATYSVFLLGCYGTHDYMIYTKNKARLENRVGRAFSINVCSKYNSFNKQYSTRQKINIPADLFSEIELVWDSRHEIKYDQNGGFDYLYSGDVNYIHFALDHSSFDLVKLCISEFDGRDVIVNRYDSCPYGTTEQLDPRSCY